MKEYNENKWAKIIFVCLSLSMCLISLWLILTDITQRQLILVFPICSSYYFIKSRLDTILIEKTKC